MSNLAERPLRSAYPRNLEALPEGVYLDRRYGLRFASSAADLAAVQKLRFEVFNLELGEGLESAYATGRDEDEFDPWYHHLMVLDRESGAIVGTYRLQTRDMAEAGRGFYAATEFDLGGLPDEMLTGSVEVGRACVHEDHRNGRVLHLLWWGLIRYATWNNRRYLFGCCSVDSREQAAGWGLYEALSAQGLRHPDWTVSPLPELICEAGEAELPELPPLFASYVKLGAKICGAPALDASFGVIDFFMVIDLDELGPSARRRLFRPLDWSAVCAG